MKHELPAFPYAYDALEPHYDEQTLRLHHDAHHKAYVDGLNNAEGKLAEAREKGDFALVTSCTASSGRTWRPGPADRRPAR